MTTRTLLNLLALLLALTACGGGDPDDDGRGTLLPLDCKAHPEACQ